MKKSNIWVEDSPDYVFASISCQGDRNEQMDRSSYSSHREADIHALAVFDGHGNPQVADYLNNFMINELTQYLASHETLDFPILANQWFSHWNQRLFQHLSIKTNPESSEISLGNNKVLPRGGSTACIVVIQRGIIFCANVGDSKAVLCRNGVALPLSNQHRASYPEEYDRVKSDGGYFKPNGRIGDSGLNISRSLGDFHCYDTLKMRDDQLCIRCLGFTCTPEIKFLSTSIQDNFIIIASDGVWDRCEEKDLVQFVRLQIADPNKKDLSKILEHIMQYVQQSKVQIMKKDNMTISLILFKKQASVENLKSTMLQAFIAEQIQKYNLNIVES